MKNLFLVFLIGLSVLYSCKDPNTLTNVSRVVTTDFELYKVDNSKHTLVLFPGGSNTSKEIKEEFDILDKSTQSGISVLLMNFNRHLWLDEKTAKKLSEDLEKTLIENKLDSTQLSLGGFSIGGNVALTLSEYLHQAQSSISPTGIFVVDSPIDLQAVYESSVVDTQNSNLSKDRLAEPKGIIGFLESKFGKEEELFNNLEEVSPFTFINRKVNISSLKESKLRFYTEPDKEYHKEVRKTEFENTNAFTIQQVCRHLREELNWEKVELIETSNKGYRSDGTRNPHSWSIVDVDDLITWIKN